MKKQVVVSLTGYALSVASALVADGLPTRPTLGLVMVVHAMVFCFVSFALGAKVLTDVLKEGGK